MKNLNNSNIYEIQVISKKDPPALNAKSPKSYKHNIHCIKIIKIIHITDLLRISTLSVYSKSPPEWAVAATPALGHCCANSAHRPSPSSSAPPRPFEIHSHLQETSAHRPPARSASKNSCEIGPASSPSSGPCQTPRFACSSRRNHYYSNSTSDYAWEYPHHGEGGSSMPYCGARRNQ